MRFPSEAEFLEVLGIEPTEEDPSMAYCRYVKKSSDGFQELDVSFSAVAESFQVVFRNGGRETVVISSEKVRTIQLRHEKLESSIHVVFDIDNVTAEAVIRMEPDLHCHWWILRSA